MWTTDGRARHSRGGPRHPSGLTSADWALAPPPTPPINRGGTKRTPDARKV